MHEMAMVRSVVDIVLEEAERVEATEVLGVYLTVGYSRDIVEDVFESMFAWMCRGTVAEGAVLHLTRVPFTVRCEECGRIFPVNTRCRDTPRCPQCDASHYRLHSGMEFYVNDIE
ncbi:hydrogenase maturation nickel metallochaperone HypA, partial [Adlercreutzia equolifaciens]|uniref:hydrogenase maturation nickel metallochaperone HypA/HybF n=1 Tax=Adlercreutzia equolifaciens TaxID=446660 RepID=UPI002431391C